MAFHEAVIDSVKFNMPTLQWIATLKRNDLDLYYQINLDSSQAGIILKGLEPGHGYKWIYDKFLFGQDIKKYDLASLLIDQQDGNTRARLKFQENNIKEVECAIEYALALAFRKRARILVDEDRFIGNG